MLVLSNIYMSTSWAQDSAVGSSLGSYSWEAMKVILSLAFVLLIFYLLVNAFKKYTGVSVKSNASVRILGGLTLGGKEKVVILQAGNVNFLLGVSGSGISKIHQFKDDEFDMYDGENKHPIKFNQQIEKILGKKTL